MIEWELSRKVVKVARELHGKIGPGLLERCYRNGMVVLLEKEKLSVLKEQAYPVHLENVVIGDYYADLVVEGKIIVECKAVRELNNVHLAQLMNYLRISGIEVGYLINFRNAVIEFRRVVVTGGV